MTFQHDLSNGASVKFTTGTFDDWLVVHSYEGHTTSPTDEDCFRVLLHLAGRYGIDVVYADFVSVFDLAGRVPSHEDLNEVTRISGKYKPDCQRAESVLAVLYMTMIAEENKASTTTGKRIKRLGVYDVLYRGVPPEDAARFACGKTGEYLRSICRGYGF